MGEKRKLLLRSYALNLAGAAALFLLIQGLAATGAIDSYLMTVLLLCCINIILAVSLNLTAGFLGEVALGHAGFMSVGAFVGGIVTKSLPATPDLPRLLLGLLAGGLAAAVFGLLIGVPVLRLKGDYLAIITLGFGEIIRVVIENLTITGGAKGLRGIPRLVNFPNAYWITALVITILFAFVRSRHGRAITAIREDDIAARACGVNNTYYKVLAFTLAAFFAGVAGGLYAHQYGVVVARTFNFNRSVELLVIVVLGGMGSLTGSALSAIVLTVLPEALRAFADYRMLLYSAALIVVMIFKPSGLLGRREFSLTGFLLGLQGLWNRWRRHELSLRSLWRVGKRAPAAVEKEEVKP